MRGRGRGRERGNLFSPPPSLPSPSLSILLSYSPPLFPSLSIPDFLLHENSSTLTCTSCRETQQDKFRKPVEWVGHAVASPTSVIGAECIILGLKSQVSHFINLRLETSLRPRRQRAKEGLLKQVNLTVYQRQDRQARSIEANDVHR